MALRNGEPDIRVYYCRNSTNGHGLPPALAKLESSEHLALEAVPCGGRIDPRYILKAFESGARAVCVLACCSGHCKLMEGNLRAIGRTNAVRDLLAEAGLDPSAVQIFLPKDTEDSTLELAARNVAGFVDKWQSTHEVMA